MLKRVKKAMEGMRRAVAALARDTAGNALVIMTAALIPLAGMVGGGIDISRMYIVKTRLQHACDSGALAGRKTMGGGTWSFNNNYARGQAEKFFDANYDDTAYGVLSGTVTRSFTENAGKVTGNAQATLPLTLMRIFGRTTEVLAVTCSSEMRLPNTDVMFVLDTTGSMGDPQPGDTVTKLAALKTSVKCFYEIVARLDTDANCTTGVPSGGTGDQVQIRFGFMPYSTNVNVGKLLPTSYFADSWDYQTREAMWNSGSSNWTQTSSAVQSTTPVSATNVPYSYCNDATAASSGYNSQTGYTPTSPTTRYYDKTVTTVTGWTAANGGTCSGTQTKTRYFETLQTSKTFSQWQYKQLPVDVSLLKNGTEWRNSFDWPVGPNGTNRTITWDGCIEERQTVNNTTNYAPIPKQALDLDIDLVPDPNDKKTLWAPALPQLIYSRAVTSSWNQLDRATYVTTTNFNNNIPYYCPTEARKLQTWPNPNDFDDYVDSLVATGNTYHDTGLAWGARFASPSGIFASENKATNKGGEIERHIIFMTDGDACTGNTDYGPYGVPWFDRRTTSNGSVPTGGCTSNSYTLTEQVNKRTEGLCAAIKNKTFEGRQAFTLWVIAFGNLASTTETRLQNCATSGRYFKATSAASLQATFKSIADQISMLRLTK